MRSKNTSSKPILARARKPAEAAARTPIQKFIAPIVKHWRAIVIAAGGVVLIGAAVGGFYWLRNDREDRAARAYAHLQGIAADRAADAALKAGKDGKIDEKTLEAATIKDLNEFISKYGNTGAGRAAQYELASLYFEAGKTKEAAALFAEVAAKGKGPERTMAAVGVADCAVAAGDYKSAIPKYQKVYDAAPDGFPGVAVGVKLAACLEHEGKADDAAKIYRRILDYNALSPFAADAAEALSKIEQVKEGSQ